MDKPQRTRPCGGCFVCAGRVIAPMANLTCQSPIPIDEHGNDITFEDHLRQRAEAAEQDAARLRAGEADELPPPGTNYTPAQWIRRWNQATPEQRLARAEHILADAVTASRCFAMDHAAELDHLRRIQQRARAVAESWRAAGMRRADESGDSVWVAMAHVCAQVLAALDGDVDVTDADGEPVGGDGRG